MKRAAILALMMASAPAGAEVVSASPNGFVVRQTVDLVVKPSVAFAAFGNVGQWWDKDHTYSGDSANLDLRLSPGSCFCERFPDGGGVEHMRVTYVDPGKRLILAGALGPLLYEATSGVMDVQLKPRSGGSQLTLEYKAAGFATGGGEKLASEVDAVLAGQMRRLRAYVTKLPRT